jgi:hypothetical protein
LLSFLLRRNVRALISFCRENPIRATPTGCYRKTFLTNHFKKRIIFLYMLQGGGKMNKQSPVSAKTSADPKKRTEFMITAKIIDIDTISTRATMKIHYQSKNGTRKTEWFWIDEALRTALEIRIGLEYCLRGTILCNGKRLDSVTPAQL